MLKLTRSAIGGVAVATMIAAGSLVAVPAANAEPGFYGAEVIKVGSRSWKGGKNWNRNWNGGGHYNYGRWNNNWNNGWNNNWWVGPAIGFGAGVLLGSALAQPRYYYAPPVLPAAWATATPTAIRSTGPTIPTPGPNGLRRPAAPLLHPIAVTRE